MTPEHRRYLILQSGVGAAVVNALLNGGLGWLITRGVSQFPLWELPGAAADLLATAFGVTFGTCLGLAFQVPRDVASNKVSLRDLPGGSGSVLARLPRGVLKRAIALGTLAVPVFGLPLLVLLAALGAQALDRTTFILVKGGFAALEAALVTPLLVLAVLLDLSRANAGAAAAQALPNT